MDSPTAGPRTADTLEEALRELSPAADTPIRVRAFTEAGTPADLGSRTPAELRTPGDVDANLLRQEYAGGAELTADGRTVRLAGATGRTA